MPRSCRHPPASPPPPAAARARPAGWPRLAGLLVLLCLYGFIAGGGRPVAVLLLAHEPALLRGQPAATVFARHEARLTARRAQTPQCGPLPPLSASPPSLPVPVPAALRVVPCAATAAAAAAGWLRPAVRAPPA